MSEQVRVEITSAGPAAVMAFKDTSICNMEGIAAAAEQIRRFIEQKRPKRLVFDFEQVKFFSSQVLGLLLKTRAELETYNGEVVISAIDPQLHRVFKITHLDRIFEFFPDKESAISSKKQ